MSAIAIITARGGSKRIPGKNIKAFLGKPILAYSIETALKSGIFNTVMVSTDDKQIAEIAVEYGAEVPFFREPETSDDYSTTTDVLKEVITKFETVGKSYDYACCIYPTAPFITSEKLISAFNLLKERQAPAVIPVVRFAFPPQRAFTRNGADISYWMPEKSQMRSQDLDPLYHDAGQFYFFSVISFKQTGRLVSEGSLSVEYPEMEVQDIDTETDWELAELKYRLLNG